MNLDNIVGFYKLESQENFDALLVELGEASNQYTVPLIFVNGEGYDISSCLIIYLSVYLLVSQYPT